MTMQAQIDDQLRDGRAIARVEGEIDASNVAWAGSRLRRLLTNRSHVLVVDLAATTYLDSAGIAMLFELAGDLRLHQQELRLVVGGSPVARMLVLTGLDQAAAIHPTVDAALQG
jgi:anti-sigma B factor antagonist